MPGWPAESRARDKNAPAPGALSTTCAFDQTPVVERVANFRLFAAASKYARVRLPFTSYATALASPLAPGWLTASSSLIVTVAVDCPPIPAPPAGLDSTRP